MTEAIELIKEDLGKVKDNLVKDFTLPDKKKKRKLNFKMVLLVLLLIGAGVGSGYFLFLNQNKNEKPTTSRDVAEENITKGMTVGVVDEKTFRDSAEGKLEKGGLNGEGSHHLVRPGGESQNVYLTSSIVDLDKFIGHQIKIWGETFSAKKAGWLMDVGKIKVLD